MKKYWKRMDQSLITIENIETLIKMFKIKNGMSPAIVSDIFLPETEIIKTLCNKMAFFYLLYKWQKRIFPRCKNLEEHALKL